MSSCWEFLEFSQKNKPQGNALSGGIMVLLISGFQIGWIFDSSFEKLPWTEGHSEVYISFAIIAFYVAAIVGIFAASSTVNRLTKKNIYVSLKHSQ